MSDTKGPFDHGHYEATEVTCACGWEAEALDIQKANAQLQQHIEEAWTPSYEPATPLHIGPSEVVVNGERYVRETTLFAAMQRADALGAAIEHVITDSPGTPETVKDYLRKALR